MRYLLLVMLLSCGILQGQEEIKLGGQEKITANKSREFEFRIKDGENRQIRFHIDARLDWTTLGGYTGGMRITVNGQPVPGKLLLNKPLEFKMRNGSTGKWAAPESTNYTMMYAGDFGNAIKTNKNYVYGLIEENQHPFRFIYDISGMVQHVGTNKITVHSTFRTGLVIDNVGVIIDDKPMPRINDEKAMVVPAPDGLLPDYCLKTPVKEQPRAQIDGQGQLLISQSGRKFIMRSRFSVPDGKWLEFKGDKWEMNTPEYRVERRYELHGDHVKFYDTFTNRRNEVTGVMLENRLILPENPRKILRNGLNSELIQTHGYVITAELGGYYAGMIAEDDIFRNHAVLGKDTNTLIMQERSLGLPPQGSHTLEWSIYLLSGGNYYDFVNAVRRNWNVNFTWEGSLTFPYRGGKEIQKWNVGNINTDFVRRFLNENPVKMVMTHVPTSPSISRAKSTIEKPWMGHGTAEPLFDWWSSRTKAMTAIMAEVDPGVEVYAYLHKNLCTEPGYPDKYRDSIALTTNGKPRTSGQSGLFQPTVNNSYGKALAATYRYLVEELGTHIYMDEICLSVTDWAPYPEWDNCTVEINPSTHKVIRKLSSPNLLIRPWLEEMIAYLKSKNRKLLANGPPVTRTLQRHHIQHFVEAGMGESGLINAHYSTPLAWDGYAVGLAAYRHFRNSLNFGALGITWGGEWNRHTFPFTPLEINAGYLIGDERIITRLSGRYGWNDASEAEFHVYDGDGKPVSGANVKNVGENGNNVFEIRMPSDHIAVIVRK